MFTTGKIETNLLSYYLLFKSAFQLPGLAGRAKETVMERQKKRERGRRGGCYWMKQKGVGTVSAYVREIPQIGHSRGSDGLKLHSGVGGYAHTQHNHTQRIIQIHTYWILREA